MFSQDELNRLRGELNLFGDELRDVAFIKALCAAFEVMAIEYYSNGAHADERLSRLGEISAALRQIGFGEDKPKFTIAAEVTAPVPPATQPGYRCPPGMRCIDGNCVPVRGN